MTTTTAGDLLGRAQHLATDLHASPRPVTVLGWQQYDTALHRLLGMFSYPGLPALDAEDAQTQRRIDRIWDDYPFPLTAASSTLGYTRGQFAAAYDTTEREVQRRIDAGLLPTHRSYGQLRIGSRTDRAVPDLAPPDAASTHPFDRLTVTVGTLGDLLHVARGTDHHLHGQPNAAERSTVVAHLLAITVVAGRHTATWMGPEAAERPLLVARYAEHSLDRLSSRYATGPLLESASFRPPAHTATPNEALDAALRTWARAAHTEVHRQPPSAAVLRNIASQAAHVYAAADHLAAGAAEAGALPTRAAADLRAPLRLAARDFVALADQWKPFTTLQRPSLEYVSATENLSAILIGMAHHGATQRSRRNRTERLGMDEALADLRAAADDVLNLAREMAPWPARLAYSRVLIAPARQLSPSPERLKAIRRGTYVPARLHDIRQLIRVAEQAEHSAGQARAALARIGPTITVTDLGAVDARPQALPRAVTAPPRIAVVCATSSEPVQPDIDGPAL